MQVQLPRASPRILVGAAIAWFVLVCFAALVDPAPDDVVFGVAHDFLETLAAAVIAVVFGAGLLERWQRREWKRRTESLAIDAVLQMRRNLRIVASASVAIVTGSSLIASEAAEVIDLPWSDTRTTRMHFVAGKLRSHISPLFGDRPDVDPTTEQRAASKRMAERGPELEARADKLVALAADLGPYLDDERGIALRKAVSKLRSELESLIDPLPGIPMGDAFVAMFALTNATDVLKTMPDICIAVSKAFEALQEEVKDPTLRAKLAELTAQTLADDAEAAEEMRADEELDAMLKDYEGVLDEFSASTEELVETIRGLSTTGDPADARAAQLAVGEVRHVLNTVAEGANETEDAP
jgi:hypothetical protein